MRWLRRIAAGALLLLALICTIGAIRTFTHDLPDASFGSGVSAALAPAVLAVCAFSIAAPWTAALQQRWWLHAALAVLGWCVLFFGLAATSEAIAPRGFGEGAMLFLLPLEGFPVLLVVSGVVRLIRGAGA